MLPPKFIPSAMGKVRGGVLKRAEDNVARLGHCLELTRESKMPLLIKQFTPKKSQTCKGIIRSQHLHLSFFAWLPLFAWPFGWPQCLPPRRPPHWSRDTA